MIKTAGELISEAQTHINCVDVMSAKAIYDDSNNAVTHDGAFDRAVCDWLHDPEVAERVTRSELLGLSPRHAAILVMGLHDIDGVPVNLTSGEKQNVAGAQPEDVENAPLQQEAQSRRNGLGQVEGLPLEGQSAGL